MLDVADLGNRNGGGEGDSAAGAVAEPDRPQARVGGNDACRPDGQATAARVSELYWLSGLYWVSALASRGASGPSASPAIQARRSLATSAGDARRAATIASLMAAAVAMPMTWAWKA